MIGAGNVSTHISRHLHSAGHQISCIYSRTAESAGQLADELGVSGTAKMEDVPTEADFYIVALPDREVLPVAEKFRHTNGVWLHTAGAVSVDVFTGIFSRYGVMYPLQTLSRTSPLEPSLVPILVEGSSPEDTESIFKLARSVYDSVEVVDSHRRLVIHAAAVFANNFSNHMVHVARQLMAEQEINPALLDPLLEETFEKIKRQGTALGRTGPAIRGDHETMNKHIELLKGHPEWEKLYTFISRDIESSRE